MKFLAAFFSFLLFVGVIALGALSFWGMEQYRGVSPLQSETVLTIKKGSSVSRIANDLADANVITNPYVFRVAHKVLHTDQTVKAGTYQFLPSDTMESVFQKLIDGNVHTGVITIPEGLTSWQIINLLNEHFEDDIKDIPAEGSMLPETYQYAYNDRENSAAFMVQKMQSDMQVALRQLWNDRAENLPLDNVLEALTLASIVEKETGVAGERRKVAGVFINRLRKNMLLQTDPTVIYALTKGQIQTDGQGPLGRRLLRKDLNVDSPYNTYKYAGLPPGPIANPGFDSIAAVLKPETHEYLYFVANGTGGHAFAKTLAEHNRNVAQWRKIRSRQ